MWIIRGLNLSTTQQTKKNKNAHELPLLCFFVVFYICQKKVFLKILVIFEPRRKKTGLWGIRPGPTQTGLCSHRSMLEAVNFGNKYKKSCTIRIAKTKVLISYAVTAQLSAPLFSLRQKSGFLMTSLI